MKKDTTPPISQNDGVMQSPVAQDSKKAQRTEIILDAIILGLLILSFVFSCFVPIVRMAATQLPDFSVNISPLNILLVVIDESDQNNAYLDAFVENGGKNLLYDNKYDSDIDKLIRENATEEQIASDVAFKREYKPSVADRLDNADRYIGYVEFAESAQFDYITKITELSEQERDELQRKFDAAVQDLFAISNEYIDEIERFNFEGFRQFVNAALYDYRNNALDEQKVNEYEEKYLLNQYGYDKISALLQQYDDLELAIDLMPTYAGLFRLSGSDDNSSVQIFTYSAVRNNEGFGLFFGMFMLVTALIQLFLAFPAAMRLLRAVKGQPRKEPKQRKKFIQIFFAKNSLICATVINILFGILTVALGGVLASALISAFSVGIVFTLLINVMLIAAEVLYKRFVAQHPQQA